jgi:hypothetical protein
VKQTQSEHQTEADAIAAHPFSGFLFHCVAINNLKDGYYLATEKTEEL